MDFLIRHLESVKNSILAEEQSQLAQQRNRVAQEVSPKYTEIEQLKNASIEKLDTEYVTEKAELEQDFNNKMSVLKQRFENSKQAVLENAENKKTELFNTTFEAFTFEIRENTKKVVEGINAQIKALTKE